MWFRRFLGGAVLVVVFLSSGLRAGAQDSVPAGDSSARTERSRIHAREQWFLRGRIVRGHSAAELRQHAYRQKLSLRKLRQAAAPRALSLSSSATASSAASATGWVSLGPAPLCSDASAPDQQNCLGGLQNYNWVSGRATAVAIDPADPSGNTVYVGGAVGGLWKSSNAGPLCPDASTTSWNVAAGSPCGTASSMLSLTEMGNQPPGVGAIAVGAIAVQPPTIQNPGPGVVLAGTGETNGSLDSYYGVGILRSSDGGNTWGLIGQDIANPAHSFAGIGFSQIAFSTSNPSQVVAATATASQGLLDGEEKAQTNLGIYYSNNAGLTWNYAQIADGTKVVGPASVTAVVYNAAYNNGAGAFFAAVRFHGFYVSTDGASWSRLSSQPGALGACLNNPCPIYRGALAVVPGRNEMYAWFVGLVGSNVSDGGIWQTIDGGNTWKPVDETGLTQCGDASGCGTENGAYNLTLTAVPDSTPDSPNVTDLYAGAVNLYKCTLVSHSSVSPIPCTGTANTFLNLTHVYGCDPLGAIARVHPSQHAIDFLPVNNGQQMVMYFANDGGIYRTLDGYSGLTSGNCATPNQFDSLNQTLGSMTQFVALAQDPSNANTLLGGTQGNGSAATANGLNSAQWVSVNSGGVTSGDGGYSEINPDNPDEWFTENTGVSIQRCTNGIGCGTQDFNLVVSSATVGGDGGPLYTPYLLDPRNSGELIVGTCRVWRGTTAGQGFTPLSPNFETGAAAGTGPPCAGNEVNTVRSLAAGGPPVNGSSSVIYAGTDGTGPLAQARSGGQMWVMTLQNGLATWANVTGNGPNASSINPQNFPVSGIAIDTSDGGGNVESGQTAYVTIMGFGASHIWKTKNAGQSWSDFTGSSPEALPDAPANTVVVSPLVGSVYVGTDVGVFSSQTGTPHWVPVGGNALPDVPVTVLRVFSDGLTIWLRAATYGRGVWQFPLQRASGDFQIAIPDPIRTAFASQPSTFNGTVDFLGGSGGPVTLTCTPVSNCTAVLNLDDTFTVTAEGTAVGDYSFNLQAVSGSLTRNTPLTLRVVDFGLSPPSPAAITLPPGTSSGPIGLQVSFLGSSPGNETINLACTAPNGVTCNFSPSAALSSAQGNPVNITLTVAADSSAAGGSSTLQIAASSSAASKTVSQPLGLTVIRAGYALALNSGSLTLPARQTPAPIPATATAANGYSSAVNLKCTASVVSGPGPAPSCTIPATVMPTASGAAFQVVLGVGAAGSYSFSIQGVGSDAGATTFAVPLAATFYDFTVSVSPGSQTVTGGQTATYTLSLAPTVSSTFLQPVTLACAQPAPAACSFDPGRINAGDGMRAVKLTVVTTPSMAWSGVRMRPQARALLYAMLLPGTALILVFAGFGKTQRRQGVMCVVLGSVVLLVILQAACGGGLTGGSTSPPPSSQSSHTYVFTVNVSEGGLQAAQPAQLTLVVQ